MKLTVHGNADALLALFHAERTGKRNLICETILSNELLELFHNLPGTLEVAGGADTNCDFHKINHAKGKMRMVASFPDRK